MPTLAERIEAARAEREATARVLFDSPAFRRKLARTLAVVTVALERSKRPVLTFTGGKDSMTVLALVHKLAPETPVAWSDDELEYPETVELMTYLKAASGDQIIITTGVVPHAGWFTPWHDKPYWRPQIPGTRRIRLDHAEYLGRQGFDLTFLGLREEESQLRRDWLRRVQIEQGIPLYPVTGSTGMHCCPIASWSADDVHALIVGWGLPLNPVYDRLAAIGIPRHKQRVGPLPLVPRHYLAEGWPEMLARLEARYGARWHDRGRWG